MPARALFALLILLLAGCAGASETADHANMNMASDPFENGTVIDPPVQLADWSLPNSAGGTLGLADLRGRPVLLFFGYTHCPDYCPTNLADFKRVKAELGPDGDKVAYVLISIDPARDTPDVISRYLAGFDASFIGLQGDEATLRRIGRDYGLYYEKQAGDGDTYIVDHSTATYLIDTTGRLRIVYTNGVPATTLTRDVRQLLGEG